MHAKITKQKQIQAKNILKINNDKHITKLQKKTKMKNIKLNENKI